MLILVPILVLLLVSFAMAILRYARPGSPYNWLLSSGAALAAWPMVLLAGLSLPTNLEPFAQESGSAFQIRLALMADWLSWPYAAALATLALAVILTDSARAPDVDPSSWSSVLALTALGLLAVLSGNPVTLLLSWTAIDLVELVILLSYIRENEPRAQVVITFSARVIGSGLLVAAVLAAGAAGEALTFTSIPAQASLLLIMAAGLRLGVLPLHLPFIKELPVRRGLGTSLRLVPAAAALVLVGRTAQALSNDPGAMPLSPYLLALTGLAALYAGFSWVFAADELAGRPAWLLGMASLAVASALRGQPTASLAWGIAALFSGGLLFLSSARERRLNWLTLTGLLGFCALPFTPAWEGARLFISPFPASLALLLLGLALLLFGYAWHTFRPGKPLLGVEPWVWLVYPLGLALLPVTHFVLGWRNNMGAEAWRPGPMPLTGWVVGVAAALLFGLGVLWSERGPRVPRAPIVLLESIFSLNWLYSGLSAIYRALGRFLSFVTLIFEGEGGVLWALLVLVLLLASILLNGGA